MPACLSVDSTHKLLCLTPLGELLPYDVRTSEGAGGAGQGMAYHNNKLHRLLLEMFSLSPPTPAVKLRCCSEDASLPSFFLRLL
jgi:carbamoylphosphate synthase large subunit